MDKTKLIIQEEITNTVPAMIDEAISTHIHGTNAQYINGYSLINSPQPAITAPTGGLTSDDEARTAINDILTLLRNLNLMN